jgi:hypothetical protein
MALVNKGKMRIAFFPNYKSFPKFTILDCKENSRQVLTNPKFLTDPWKYCRAVTFGEKQCTVCTLDLFYLVSHFSLHQPPPASSGLLVPPRASSSLLQPPTSWTGPPKKKPSPPCMPS